MAFPAAIQTVRNHSWHLINPAAAAITKVSVLSFHLSV
jgi:hypothetical protein